MIRAVIYGVLAGTILTLVSAQNSLSMTECLKVCGSEPASSKLSWACRIAGAEEEIMKQRKVFQVLNFVIAFILLPLGICGSVVLWKHTFNVLKAVFAPKDEIHFGPLFLRLYALEKIIEADQKELKSLRQKIFSAYGQLRRANVRIVEEVETNSPAVIPRRVD